MPIPEKINYRGIYREYDPRGYDIVYNVGDVVDFAGKKYIAIERNKKSLPTKKESLWKEYTGDYENYFYGSDEPLNASVSDRWVDTATGRMYTYIEDKNGFHWVEF